jgi:hypothetical protein
LLRKNKIRMDKKVKSNKAIVTILTAILFLISVPSVYSNDILQEIMNKKDESLSDKQWRERLTGDFYTIVENAKLMNELFMKYGQKQLSTQDLDKAKESAKQMDEMFMVYSDNIPKDKKLEKRVDMLMKALSFSHNLSVDFGAVSRGRHKAFTNSFNQTKQYKYFKEELSKYIKKYGIPKKK